MHVGSLKGRLGRVEQPRSKVLVPGLVCGLDSDSPGHPGVTRVSLESRNRGSLSICFKRLAEIPFLSRDSCGTCNCCVFPSQAG